MSDRYQGFAQSPLGKLLVKNLGLPNPVPLERYAEGAPLVDGTVAVGGTGRLAESLPGLLDPLGIASTTTTDAAETYKGLVFDATGLTSIRRPGALRDFFTPLLRSLDPCPRIVVLGTPPEQVKGGERVAQRALEGFTRSLGKEVGRGGTVQLVYVAEGAEAAVASTLALPALPEVGLRLRPGRPDRRHRQQEGDRGQGLAAPAGRQDRPGHRRQPRHRRADRPGPAPRRRHRDRRRRPPGRQRAPGPDERARRRPPRPRHHRQGRAAADRPPRQGEARRRRHRRAQRRHHPRQEARQHGRGPLELRPRTSTSSHPSGSPASCSTRA